MRYKIVEVKLATKTINPADPTEITKKVSEEVVGECETLDDAEKKIGKMEEEDAHSYDMDLAMCGGDSELMPPRGITERYVFDEVDQKVFQLGFVDTGMEETEFGPVPTCEPLLMVIKDIKSVAEIHPEGWQM